MKTKEIKYEAWLSSETMHNNSLNWISELKFARDEQLFFDDLVKSYTLQLIDSSHFAESKTIRDKLCDLQKETNNLLKKVNTHENGLKVIVDGINDLVKEDAYKDKHERLILRLNNFIKKNRLFKKDLFSLITGIIKTGKQKRLLQ